MRLLAGLVPALLAGQAIQFTDVAAEAGLRFTLENSPTAEKHLIESVPGGIAVFDYDGDGRTDIFFTNGATSPGREKTGPKHWNRLFRNEGGMKFRDVTEAASLAGAGYSMGAAAGDFDNDGDVDLFVAGVFRNTLYRNLGNGKFEDATAASGIGSDRWSVAAGWFDYDGDRLLDLFVVNYADWSPKFDRFCGDPSRGIRTYCHPRYFPAVANQLYRNRGNGRFEEVSASSGIGARKGRGMSLAFADYDADGRLDVFVTNDALPCFLFRNLGAGKFEETALAAGVSLPDHGKAVSAMGVDFRDADNDGRPDVMFTALAGETWPFFRNEGGGSFRDATYASKIGPLTAKRSGWGVALADFDNDGWKDLFGAGSHVNDRIAEFEAGRYKEPNVALRNLGKGVFGEAQEVGAARAHHGLAVADFDGDGRLDVVVSALGEPAELWRNTSAAGNWMEVRLEGGPGNRDGIGAVVRANGQWNLMTTAGSYASSSHTGVHFGLGGAERVSVEVTWPGGQRQTVENAAANQVLRIKEAAR